MNFVIFVVYFSSHILLSQFLFLFVLDFIKSVFSEINLSIFYLLTIFGSLVQNLIFPAPVEGFCYMAMYVDLSEMYSSTNLLLQNKLPQ